MVENTANAADLNLGDWLEEKTRVQGLEIWNSSVHCWIHGEKTLDNWFRKAYGLVTMKIAASLRLWCSFRKICLVKSPNLYLEGLEGFTDIHSHWVKRLLAAVFILKSYLEMRTRLSMNFFSAFTLLHFVKISMISYFLGTWNILHQTRKHETLSWHGCSNSSALQCSALFAPRPMWHLSPTSKARSESTKQRIEDTMLHASSCKAQCIGNHCQP